MPVDLLTAFFGQVLEADLRKKLDHAHELGEQAKGTVKEFRSQKQELEDFISQGTERLKEVEESLSALPHGPDPEEICRVKVALPTNTMLQKQPSSN